MKQQTAIEWLDEQVKNIYNSEHELPLEYILSLIKISKVTEKTQIKFAFVEGYKNADKVLYQYLINKYYDETYGK